LSFSALALWLIGHPEGAVREGQNAVAYARSLAHPFSLGFALAYAAWLNLYREDVDAVSQITDELSVLAHEQRFPYWEMIAGILHGWATAEHGEAELGMRQIRTGLENWRATGAETNRPFYLALLASACAKVARTDEAVSLIVEALDVTEKTGEGFHKAELNRIRGELVLNLNNFQNRESAAEEYLSIALAVARQQKAKSLELRAATSLADLSLIHI